MSDLSLTAYLMAMRGDDVQTIADALGVDVPTVEAALERASEAQSGLFAQLRDAGPKERPPPPASFTTRDGLVVRLETDLAATGTPGVWPLIIARQVSMIDVDSLERIMEQAADPGIPPMAAILGAAERIDAAELLAGIWREDLEADDDPQALEMFDEAPPSLSPPPIPRPIVRRPGFAVVALVPVATGEEALAALGFGNWNACPPPAEHVAILRYWNRRFGVQLRAMAHDILELDVANPPTRFADAVALAREQYAYAGDIVMQAEHDTIGTLAAALVGSAHWHFWWD